MSSKSENATCEKVVREALDKMLQASSASTAYEVHRSHGQWIVRRESASTEKSFGELIDAAVFTNLKPVS